MRIGRGPLRALFGVALSVVVASALAACGSSKPSTSSTSAASGTAKTGGSLTVLENSNFVGSWPGLDPATNTSDAANATFMNAIYGGLFEQAPNGEPQPDLATGYKFANGGKTVYIYLRHGMTFTDGTAFNAQAVVFNINRDLTPKYACLCLPNFPIASLTTQGDYTVVMNLKRVYAPIISAFFAEAPNWIVSPTALQKMGEKAFAITPVGAGPFEVVHDSPSAKLVLKKNPKYWESGKPYLDNLTFSTIGTDQSAYDALVSGQAQAYEGMSTIPLEPTAAKRLQVTEIPPGIGIDNIQLNTSIAPFNNIEARKAIYYATNVDAINKGILQGKGIISQSPTIPGGLYYQKEVPGYLTYDLAKAKSIVQSLGGLHITLGTIAIGVAGQIAEALESQWVQAGIHVTLQNYTLQALIGAFHSNKWQAMLQSAGGYNPALGTGLPFRYLSTGPFTGVHDPKLDAMIAAGAATLDPAKQDTIYKQIWAYLASEAYSPFLMATPAWNLAVHGISGPGLTATGWQIFWQDVHHTS